MSTARMIVGDVFDVVGSLEHGSVQSVITSPPYFKQRRYLPEGHPDAAKEIGQEATPGEFVDRLLDLMDLCWDVLADDGTFWINLGDKHAGSGGAGGDYQDGGLRAGQPRYGAVKGGKGWPRDQSVCWTPELLGASLAYGRNLLTGTDHRQWVTRPPAVWWKPNPMPGSSPRKFKTATELWIYGGKHQDHYWDIGPFLEPLADAPGNKYPRRIVQSDRDRRAQGATTGNTITKDYDPSESAGKVPHNVWVVDTVRYDGAHFATMPPDLIARPVVVGCPPGGAILDPFGGSGTTAMVATGHGRDCLLIDIDSRNAELALERVGMFLTVEALLPTSEGA